jgi:beta-lactamase class A
MITHSDNTATDAAMRQVDADRVRALIAKAELNAIRIPDSTRIFESYIIGARPPGVDLGWPGIREAYKNPPGPLRPPINPVETLVGNADDFVSWYERALQGAFFARSATLIEFKRIQAMSDQIVKAVPPDRPAYAKGGEIDFNGSASWPTGGARRKILRRSKQNSSRRSTEFAARSQRALAKQVLDCSVQRVTPQ